MMPKDFNKDFIKNTQELIKDSKVIEATKEKDITFILNMCLGLIVFSQEKNRNKIYTDIKLIDYSEDIKNFTNTDNVFYYLRNALAHGGFKPKSEDGVYITHLIFTSHINKYQTKCTAEISVIDFKNFLGKIDLKYN